MNPGKRVACRGSVLFDRAAGWIAAFLLGWQGPVQAADLMDCYREAFAYDAQLATARGSLKAGREAYPQGLAGLLPTVNAQVANQRTDQAYQPLAAGVGVDRYRYGTTTYSLTLTQPLFRWGAWQTYRIGELQVIQAEATFEQAHTDMMIRVTQAYFDVLYAQEALSFTRSQKSATEEKMQLARRNFEAGLATVVDFREANARLDLIQASEIAASNDLSLKRLALKKLIGRSPDRLAVLKNGSSMSPPTPDNLTAWADQAERLNFTVRANEAATRIAERNIAANRAAHLPTLDLSASLNRLNQSGTLTSQLGSQNSYSQIGITLNVPLFAGFGVVSKVRQAIAQQEEAEGNLAQAKNAAAQAASEAYLNHVNGASQVRALEEAERSSLSSVAASKRGYEVGLRLNLDVLDAEQQLTQVRRDLAKARFDTLVAGLKLKAAAGALSIGDLEQLNALLTDGAGK